MCCFLSLWCFSVLGVFILFYFPVLSVKTFSEPRCSCSSRLFWFLWFFSPLFPSLSRFGNSWFFPTVSPPSFPGFFCCKELVVFSRRFLGGGGRGWGPFCCSRWAPRFLFPFLLREGTRYFSTCFVGVVLGGSWPYFSLQSWQGSVFERAVFWCSKKFYFVEKP